MDKFLWVEKHRPKTIEQCILSDTIKGTLEDLVRDNKVPNLMFTGPAGVGKTTVARAICNMTNSDYIIINGSDEGRMIDTLRTKMTQFCSTISLSGGGRKVVIIDEADYMNPDSVQPAMRGFIEKFAENCSFIFTCNFKNRIIEPIHSRCAVIDFGLKKDENLSLNFKEYENKKSSLFYDLIYNPKETNFLKDARLRGNRTMNGKMMFLHQAHLAFTMWTDLYPPIDDDVIRLLD